MESRCTWHIFSKNQLMFSGVICPWYICYQILVGEFLLQYSSSWTEAWYNLRTPTVGAYLIYLARIISFILEIPSLWCKILIKYRRKHCAVNFFIWLKLNLVHIIYAKDRCAFFSYIFHGLSHAFWSYVPFDTSH